MTSTDVSPCSSSTFRQAAAWFERSAAIQARSTPSLTREVRTTTSTAATSVVSLGDA
jgi:hypothetical protein